MLYQEILDQTQKKFDELKEEFKTKMQEIRGGRLSPNLIENIKVECFGSVLPIKRLGVITLTSPQEILIQVWDESYVEGVLKSLREHDLGLGIRVEGKNIYLSQGMLNQEQKKKLAKIIHEKKENIFQAARRIRDKSWREIQEGFQSGEIREDDKYRAKEKLDEAIKKFREEIEKLASQKEKEIQE